MNSCPGQEVSRVDLLAAPSVPTDFSNWPLSHLVLSGDLLAAFDDSMIFASFSWALADHSAFLLGLIAILTVLDVEIRTSALLVALIHELAFLDADVAAAFDGLAFASAFASALAILVFRVLEPC
jgi:hypothetical protein